MDVLRMYIQTRVYNINKEDVVFVRRLYSYGDNYEWKSLVNIYLPLHIWVFLLVAYVAEAWSCYNGYMITYYPTQANTKARSHTKIVFMDHGLGESKRFRRGEPVLPFLLSLLFSLFLFIFIIVDIFYLLFFYIYSKLELTSFFSFWPKMAFDVDEAL